MSTSAKLARPDVYPSFIRGLFLGEIREEMLFPYPTMPQEEAETLEMILESLHGWGETFDSHRQDEEGVFDQEARQALHELGMMGVNIPEAYGGAGASAKTFTRVFGEMGAIDGAFAVYFGAHQSIGCKGITLFGTEEQKKTWLPRCASGETVAAFCLTEPGSGSDAQGMQTKAVPDGDEYAITGQKMWISNAGYAGVFTVFAKVPVEVDGQIKHRVTAFIVDAKSEGITLGQPEKKMGIKASDTRTVTFDHVRVPKENVLGQIGEGFKIALEILNTGRLGLAAGSIAASRKIMKTATEYAANRHQFKRAIVDFEMIQKKIARAEVDLYAAEAGVFLASDLMDRGEIDYSLEAAACKIFASEMACQTASEAMQMAGGLGYSKEYPYEQVVRDTRINMIFEGTNEILRALIALQGISDAAGEVKSLGRMLKGKKVGEGLGVLGRIFKRRTVGCRLRNVCPELRGEAREVERLVWEFSKIVRRSIMRHQEQIIERQFVQDRLADIAIRLYLMCAVLSRATSEGGDALTKARVALWDLGDGVRERLGVYECEDDARREIVRGVLSRLG